VIAMAVMNIQIHLAVFHDGTMALATQFIFQHAGFSFDERFHAPHSIEAILLLLSHNEDSRIAVFVKNKTVTDTSRGWS
jgi:hypothetical protein